MDGDSLPHLTKITNEDAYVVPGGGDLVFKFKEIPDRPKRAMPVHVYVNDEQRMTADGRRIVVRIRASDHPPEGLPLLRHAEDLNEVEGEIVVKREVALWLQDR
jgi:hypothetical protein